MVAYTGVAEIQYISRKFFSIQGPILFQSCRTDYTSDQFAEVPKIKLVYSFYKMVGGGINTGVNLESV